MTGSEVSFPGIHCLETGNLILWRANTSPFGFCPVSRINDIREDSIDPC